MKYSQPSISKFLATPCKAAGVYPDSAFTVDVQAGKGSSFYRTHTYHTKVPPQGIERFIAHYTRQGQVVLDPFCGSGMTGIAAIRQQRKAVLSDLSPAASFMAYNHCRKLDVSRFLKAGRRILEQTQQEYGWIYRTRDRSTGELYNISKVIWSQTFLCPQCGTEYVLSEAAVDKSLKVLETYPCPHCRATITKKVSTLAGSIPIRIDYGRGGSSSNTPDAEDLALVERIDAMPWPDALWYPTDTIPSDGDEIPRLHRQGIDTIDKLFTRRNLLALAALWRAVGEADSNLRPSLMFAITGTIQRASRLIKFIPSLNITPGPIHGTMYVPSLFAEINVFDMFRNKLNAVARHHSKLSEGITHEKDDVCVLTQSATDLSKIPDNSIDYVFTDPPFGSNIQYSELNLLWEAWLKSRTDSACEAVVSRSQGKSIGDYCSLMTSAFSEIRRVLRPDAWMTLVFHNTSGAVWTAIQKALNDANLKIEAIHTFDKAHDTFKMITAAGAVGYDIVVNCRKCSTTNIQKAGQPAGIDAAREYISERIRNDTDIRRLHSQALGHFLVQHRPIAFDFRQFRTIAEEITLKKPKPAKPEGVKREA